MPSKAPANAFYPVAENTKEPVTTNTKEPANVAETSYVIKKILISAANHPYGIKNIRLVKKQKLVLQVIITGDDGVSQKVKWNSSNNKIVSVNNKGKATAKNKVGTAVITAKSVIDSTKKVSIKVKVVAKKTANKVLKLKQTKVQLDKKGQKSQIKIKKYTKKTTDSVYYKVISGKKYIKVNKYGKIICWKRPIKKNIKAKVQVSCGIKKKIITVKVTAKR